MHKQTLVIVATTVAVATIVQAKPNVLVIMADDLGYHDLGFQGSEHIKTPNLDRLAGGGYTFY